MAQFETEMNMLAINFMCGTKFKVCDAWFNALKEHGLNFKDLFSKSNYIDVSRTVKKSISDSQISIMKSMFEHDMPHTMTYGEKAMRDTYADAQEEWERMQKAGVRMYHYSDFSSRVSGIKPPFFFLTVKGTDYHLWSENMVAVVGTRNPSPLGTAFARGISEAIYDHGYNVVSGLALGIDSEAHRVAVRKGLPTIAVLAHGLGEPIYPEHNTDLAQEILDNGGCLVSEYPFEYAVEKYQFVERDRLQSALSQAVVIVETEVNGGAMHTARYAQEQGRLTYVLNDNRLHASGNKLLLDDNPFVKPIDFYATSIDRMFTDLDAVRADTKRIVPVPPRATLNIETVKDKGTNEND